jgi:preprotein translocase subunit SecD
MAVIVLLLALSVFIDLPKSPLWGDKIKAMLGLDLVGGTELTYQADLSQSKNKLADLDNLKSVLENRINQLGVAEPTIQTVGSDRILIELPGISDVNQAVDKIGQTYELVFMTESTDPATGAVLKDYYEDYDRNNSEEQHN